MFCRGTKSCNLRYLDDLAPVITKLWENVSVRSAAALHRKLQHPAFPAVSGGLSGFHGSIWRVLTRALCTVPPEASLIIAIVSILQAYR